jgi:hypothetical protein
MLLPFFTWLGRLWPAVPFHDSVWVVPVLGSVHLLSLVVFVSAVLVVDLRLLGLGLVRTPIAQLARTVEPWMVGSFGLLMLSGLPQIAATPLKTYHSPFFWWKMLAVLVGVILAVTVRRRMSRRTDEQLGPVWPKVVAVSSIALWTSAMVGARWIGLMG